MSGWFPPRFSVRLSEPELIKPETQTPREKLALSDIDDQPGLRYQMPGLWFYQTKESMVRNDPGEVIKEGLSKALVFFYPLAGRLYEGSNKKLIVDCNGEGVMFLKGEADVALEKLGDYVRSPCPYLEKLLYNVPGSERITGTPILLIQVTRFTCDSFALGVQFNHTMVDGYGLILFLKTVCELIQGASIPSILPVWERELLTSILNPSNSATIPKPKMFESPNMRFNCNFLDFEYLGTLLFNAEKMASNPLFFFFPKILKLAMVQSSVVLGPREIQALKNQAAALDYGPCTTFELIVACLWKCRTIALRPCPNVTVRVTFPADIRRESLSGLKYPRGYYGNGIIHVSAATTAMSLCENPITYAVQLIKEAKANLDANYIKSVLDFMVVNDKPRLPVQRNFFVSDISRIDMEKIDFGWGNPIFAGLGTATFGMSFLECLKNNNNTNERNVLVPIALPHISMIIFKHEIKKMTSASLL